MQEITGAKPVRETNFIGALKALSAMRSLGKRIQLGALRFAKRTYPVGN